jgi:alpha-L-arabinofuranosidase
MARIDILLSEPVGTIQPALQGHFAEHLGSCIYEGIWENDGPCADVVEAIAQLKPPVIRWPGGCFADDYHWQDGIGPPASRPRRVNIHWGNVIDANAFGTHEFVQLCRQVGAEPYLAGNVGSGSPAQMRNWVEYCNYPAGSSLSEQRGHNGHPAPMRIRYWGVGNENWGCGGHLTPEDYASDYRRFSTYLRDFGETPLFLIACGPDRNDLDWTRRFFEQLGSYRPHQRIHGYAAHYYCGTAGTATVYGEGQWYELLRKALLVEQLIVEQRQLMDQYDPQRRIALILDEWGTWHPPTPGRNPAFLWQQNTLRDGLVAGLTLDAFNRQADKLFMANIAQLVNVLQAPILAEKGATIRTPTYHVFDLYRGHRGGQSLRLVVDAPAILFNHEEQMHRLPGLSGSASLRGRTLTLTIVNPRIGEPAPAEINLLGGASAAIVRHTVLTHPDIQAHNTATEPDKVRPGQPQVLPLSGGSFQYEFEAQSVTRLELSLV